MDLRVVYKIYTLS